MITYLGIGSNLNDREVNVELCLQLLEMRVGGLKKRSTGFYSMPVGFSSQNEFLNIVACFETVLSPLELLDVTQAIEREMGRTEKSYVVQEFKSSRVQEIVYHDRIIDIDILLYDNFQLSTPRLTIPHPRMQEREFVMIPLAEIQD